VRRAFVALLVVATLLVPIAAAVAAPTAAQSDSGATDAGDEYTLAELREDGTHYEKPSARIDGGNVYWLTHQPAEQPWVSEKQLLEEQTVKSDTLFLNSIRVATEPQEFTVHVVFWSRETRTVRTGENTTTTEPVARNVTEMEQQITLGKGWPTAQLDLPHHQEPTRMTIWIEGLEDARWTLRHHSVATTSAVAINSEGDYLWRAATEFIFPTIIGAFVVGYLVKRALGRAGVGPMWGYGPWVLLITVLTGGVLATLFGSFAEVFVNLPYIVAGYTTLIIGIILLETYEPHVVDATFIQPQPELAKSATGEQALDARKVRKRKEKVLKSADDGVAVVRSGLRPFLARVFGRTARIEGIEHLDTEIQVADGEENLYVVAPHSEKVLEYEPEGFEWSANPWLVYAAGAVAGVGVGVYHSAAMGLFAGAATVALGALVWVTATDGFARIQPAPTHLRAAWVTSLYMATEADEATTLQESRQKRVEERAKNERDVEKALEERDTTLVEEMESPESGSGVVDAADMSEWGFDDMPEATNGEADGDEAATDGGERR